MIRVGKLLLAMTLIGAIGGHWLLLQSVAWVGMFANNVRSCSVTEALEKTFDGQHPCALCKVVEAGKRSEKTQPMIKLEVKLDFWLAPATCLLLAPQPTGQVWPHTDALSSRVETPPTPPPRLA